MEGSLSPPGPITCLANRRSSSTGRASRSEERVTGARCALAASNASTRRSSRSRRSRIPAVVGLLTAVCSFSKYCLRAATRISEGVTWSREAASKSWECSSGGIRAPTIGETIVKMFAVDNSAQILPERSGIRPSCNRMGWWGIPSIAPVGRAAGVYAVGRGVIGVAVAFSGWPWRFVCPNATRPPKTPLKRHPTAP